jgi:hypothetical protein
MIGNSYADGVPTASYIKTAGEELQPAPLIVRRAAKARMRDLPNMLLDFTPVARLLPPHKFANPP